MMEYKNVKERSQDISFDQLNEAAKKDCKYLLSSGKNVMELPMYCALGQSIASGFRGMGSTSLYCSQECYRIVFMDIWLFRNEIFAIDNRRTY